MGLFWHITLLFGFLLTRICIGQDVTIDVTNTGVGVADTTITVMPREERLPAQIMLIGPEGVGKSTFAGTFSNNTKHFPTSSTAERCTRDINEFEATWLGKKTQRFVFLDTPGLTGEQNVDNNALEKIVKALQSKNMIRAFIFILRDDNPRMNHATVITTLLRKLKEVFEDGDWHMVYQHTVFLWNRHVSKETQIVLRFNLEHMMKKELNYEGVVHTYFLDIFGLRKGELEDIEAAESLLNTLCGLSDIQVKNAKEIQCKVSEWGPWSNCSSQCGSYGLQIRERHIVRQPGFGQQCYYHLQEQRECNRHPCGACWRQGLKAYSEELHNTTTDKDTCANLCRQNVDCSSANYYAAGHLCKLFKMEAVFGDIYQEDWDIFVKDCENKDRCLLNSKCVAVSQCYESGICNPWTGKCSDPMKSEGVPCSNGNSLLESEKCARGHCFANRVSIFHHFGGGRAPVEEYSTVFPNVYRYQTNEPAMVCDQNVSKLLVITAGVHGGGKPIVSITTSNRTFSIQSEYVRWHWFQNPWIIIENKQFLLGYSDRSLVGVVLTLPRLPFETVIDASGNPNVLDNAGAGGNVRCFYLTNS